MNSGTPNKTMQEAPRANSRPAPSLVRKLSWYALAGARFSFVTAIGTGCCIAWNFIPVPEKAGLSVESIRETVFAGAVVLTAHDLSAFLCVISLCLWILSALFLKLPRRIAATFLFMGLAVLGTVMLENCTGFLISGSERSIGIFQSRLFNAASGSPALPSIIDNASLLFGRLFMFHVLILPLGMAGALAFSTRYIKRAGVSIGMPVAGTLTRFGFFLLIIIIVSVLLRNHSFGF
jgi:quinol-cytochrome oxidoreductase complex cytochrome b subunit